MFGTIVCCLLGIAAIAGMIWFVVCAFMESEATSNLVASIVALVIAFFFFTLADGCYKEHINTNTARAEVIMTNCEREV